MSTAAAKGTPPGATLADLLAAEADGDHSFELIDGELYEKQAGFRHGRAQLRLGRSLGPFDRGGGGPGPGGWWFVSEQLVRFGPERVLKPDLVGWRRERLPIPPDEDGVIELRPDWVCEIISPRHAAHDLVRKKRIYYQNQVPHYWVIDPRDSTLTVHRWSDAGYIEVLLAQAGEVVRAEPFEAIELPVGVFFGEDEEDERP